MRTEVALASIVVISYNSGESIIEALESVKNQTYKNLEVIISDDGSTDNTVQLCKRWVDKNKNRFINCKVIESLENTGITANCNRGISETKGEYIKLIAADDIMLERGMSNLINFMDSNNLNVAFSRVYPLNDAVDKKIMNTIIEAEEKNYNIFFGKSRKEQYRDMLIMRVPKTVIIGAMYRKNIFKEVGNYNEKYGMMEDYPFLIKLLEAEYKLNLLDEYCMKYRLRVGNNDDQSFKHSKRYIMHYNNLRTYRKTEIIPKMKSNNMWLEAFYMKLLVGYLHIEHKYPSPIVKYISKQARKYKQFLMDCQQSGKNEN